MGYRLFDVHGGEVTNADLQRRGPWYEYGVRKELMFVDRFGSSCDVKVNAAKANDPTAPDILEGQLLADLKCQNTPFFSAARYGMDAQTSVTFNLKDAFAYEKYLDTQGTFPIYFWVDWVATRIVYGIGEKSVRPMTGVWRIDFAELNEMRHDSPIHWYNERAKNIETDQNLASKLLAFEPRLEHQRQTYSIRSVNGGNAACSYLLNLDNLKRVA